MRGSGNRVVSISRLFPHPRSLFHALQTLSVLFFLLCHTVPAHAEETPDTVSAENLEYDAKTKKYTGKGTVQIKTKDFQVAADEIVYFSESGDIEASGHVRYEDSESVIFARRAVFNTEMNTGRLFDAEVSYRPTIPPPGRKDEKTGGELPLHVPGQGKKSEQITYHISGKEIEKRSDQDYYSPDASLTTCDAPVPAWCFRGRDINLILDDSVSARNVALKIKDIPVLYAPYLWAPLITERKTGLLVPVVAYSKLRGFNLNVPYFWAIAENRDATFILDIFTKRGIGTALEYRFLNPGGTSSNWWAYHIRDSERHKDYWETKLIHEDRRAGSIGGFINFNYVNEKDFYREFRTSIQTRAQRFLESTGEVQMPLRNARLYLLSQYWVDLKTDSGDVPQRLPEIGYVLHPVNAGPVLLSGSLTASNIWRDNGLSSRRIDIYPGVSHSFGKDLVVSQKANLRATLYSFSKDREDDETAERSAFEYDILGHARFFRKYAAFTHVVEPGIRYHFITSSENSLSVFDSAELFKKTSRFELTLLNRFIAGGREVMSLRIAQGMETYYGDRPFLPLTVEAAMSRPFPVKLNASYDVHTGELNTVSSDLGFRIFQTTITFGERYNRTEDVFQYRTGMVMDIDKSLQLAGGVWYDAKEGKMTDMNVSLRYLRQCWGFKVELEKKPKDYSVSIMYELSGLISNIPKK